MTVISQHSFKLKNSNNFFVFLENKTLVITVVACSEKVKTRPS